MVQGKQDARSLPQMAVQAVQVVRAATSGQLRTGVASAPTRLSTSRTSAAVSPTPTAPSAPTSATAASTSGEALAVVVERLPNSSAGEPPVDAASPSPVEALDGSGDGDDSSAELPAISHRRRRGRRGVRVLLRVLVAAALLLLGVAVGIGVSIPVTTGHVPSWLSFATRLLPSAAATATATATLAPTPAVTTQPQVAGSLVVGVPACTGGSASFTLANTGGKPERWSVGSPDAQSAVFASGPGATGAATLASALAPGVTVTLYATDPGASGPGAVYHIVVVATSGTAQLVASAC
jgi:hypothetical protein